MRRASEKKRSQPKHKASYLAADDETDDDETEVAGFEKRRRRPRGSLRQWAVALLEDDAVAATAEISGVAAPTDVGLVLFATGGVCRVLFEDGQARDCLVAPDVAASQRSDLAVGDEVELTSGPSGQATVVGVLPRTSVLSRPDSGPGGTRTERVIAANVDFVVVVASTKQPALRPRLLDRYAVAAERGGSRLAIAITKIDLLTDRERDEQLAALEPYRDLGIPVVSCSSTQGEGLAELTALLAGATAVLVGQSGVGKSSLLNALRPDLAIETQDTGHAGKGRHTTTASTLHFLAGGTRIIDTPGIREFGLWDVSRQRLRELFHEFDEVARGCRYSDCCHAQEPACAVRSAAESHEISSARYESYLRLLADL